MQSGHPLTRKVLRLQSKNLITLIVSRTESRGKYGEDDIMLITTLVTDSLPVPSYYSDESVFTAKVLAS